jgi:WD40 repeat protein/serine/threonine protein kinase
MSGEADTPPVSPAQTIFTAALELPSTERSAYLGEACGEDQQLRQRVEALLRAHEAPEGFLPEKPRNPPADPFSTTSLTDSLTEQAGDTIGRYKLRRKIGEGGCGVVYMAEQEEPVRRKVALKIIKLGMDTKQVVARFEAERQALALMDHANIAKVLDAGATETGRPYFVMELVGGIKITDHCDQNHLTTRQRLDLFVQVCRAIQHAHQKGVIHRDIKPSNVLVATQDGVPVPKVIDFGIAKATQGRLIDQTVFTAFEQFLGTPAYMSPEQAQLGSLDVDTRSDIYSLGVLLYELLTGKTPFDSKELLASGLDAMRRTIQEKEPPTPSTRLKKEIVGDDVRRLDSKSEEEMRVSSRRLLQKKELIRLLRGDLDWIVMKCLEKDRARRYDTANGLARDIERHLNNEPVVARPPSRLYIFQKLVRRNKLILAAAAIIILVLFLGVAGIFSQWHRAEQHASLERGERQRAERASKKALATLVQMEAIEIRRAEEYYDAGDRHNMLPYLALVLRQNPSNRIAAERVFSTLSHRSWARLACPPLLHSNRVTSAMFSRDGRWVVTSAADSSASVWDANTGQRVCGPLMHEAEINTAEFSPDGRLVVTASDDRTARVWDARTGRPVTDPIPHPERVELARFSPDNQIFVTLCDDGVARLWDARSGESMVKPLRHGDGPPSYVFFRECDFSPDGTLLATAASEQGIVRVWSCRTGEIAYRLQHGGSKISCVRFSPDGRHLATASQNSTAMLWNLATNPPQAVSLSHRGPIENIEFSPEGRRVVTASRDKTAQVWDATSGEPIGPPLHHGDYVQSALFSPEGLRVVTASQDHTVRVWDAESGKPLTEPMAAGATAFYAAFHPDGQRVLTAANGTSALIWDISPASPLSLYPGTWSVAFRGADRSLAAGYVYENLRLQNLLTGEVLTKFNTTELDCQKCGANMVEFAPDGRLVAAAVDGGFLLVFDVLTRKLLTPARPVHSGHVVSARFSHDGQKLVSASWDGTARVWDPQTGEPLTAPMRQDSKVTWAEFSPDDRLILTTSGDAVARIWDARKGTLVRELRHEGELFSAHFSPDGTRVLTAAADLTARIWDTRTGGMLGSLPHLMEVRTALFSPDGKRIVTVCGRKYGELRLWDADTFAALTEPFGEGLQVEFSSDGQRLVIGSVAHGCVVIRDAWTGQRLSEIIRDVEANKFARFSPDNRFIITDAHDSVLIQEAPAPLLPVPEWLPELAEAVAGQRFNQQGVLEPVKPTELWAVQQKMQSWVDEGPRVSAARDFGSARSRPMKLPSSMPSATVEATAITHSFYARWAKWFLANAATRTVLPSSSLTLADHARSLAEQGLNVATAREASLLQPTNAAALAAPVRTTNSIHAH